MNKAFGQKKNKAIQSRHLWMALAVKICIGDGEIGFVDISCEQDLSTGFKRKVVAGLHGSGFVDGTLENDLWTRFMDTLCGWDS